jgi:hypothetical protein
MDILGDPCDLNNYLPDSSATQHMAPCLMDLQGMVEGQILGIEVVDGHIIKCTATGSIKIHMLDDNCETDVMYIPGLSHRLFSINKFATFGHYAMVCDNAATLYFGAYSSPMTLMANNSGNTLAALLRYIRTLMNIIPYPQRTIEITPIICASIWSYYTNGWDIVSALPYLL